MTHSFMVVVNETMTFQSFMTSSLDDVNTCAWKFGEIVSNLNFVAYQVVCYCTYVAARRGVQALYST